MPSIAISVRRLHDGNFSGFLYLLHLIPYLGSLIVLILTILPSNPFGARFDESATGYAPYPGPGYPEQPGAQPVPWESARLSASFATFTRQPAWADRPFADQLRRFAGAGSGRKELLAGALTAALTYDELPPPLAGLVSAFPG